ncbi:hypothetical protein PCAR4_1140021 [Paraburkholderia caribensis]|nr:hypothetical protein PCAR4_1140021 [Paraburkholderia caribensis]
MQFPPVPSFAQSSEQAAPINAQAVQANTAAADAGGGVDGSSASGDVTNCVRSATQLHALDAKSKARSARMQMME